MATKTVWRWINKIGMIIGAVALMLLFFQIAPWLDTKPIHDLPVGVAAPEWAQSFHTKRGGDLAFHEFGTITEEPVRATILFGGLVLIFVYLLLAERWFKRARTLENN
ncbi:MAG: hypothetical protein K0U72_06645 [Gammaproteobacteria bacterium]|nr:hypothetical protein [Gammaproteobacteria bacterium]